MRVSALCREDIIPFADLVLTQTGHVLQVISSNPSNPKFNHFVFETLAVLIRFIPGKDPRHLAKFEEMLTPQFLSILQNEIAEFTPYVLQLISQLMDLHPSTEIPAQYLTILPPLLQPGPWENHGNIPALVGLMESYVSKGASYIASHNHVAPFLGICQKLISSRLNDHYGFQLLGVMFEHIPMFVDAFLIY
jgi:exportin-2 (importin alpha re-exporter)